MGPAAGVGSRSRRKGFCGAVCVGVARGARAVKPEAGGGVGPLSRRKGFSTRGINFDPQAVPEIVIPTQVGVHASRALNETSQGFPSAPAQRGRMRAPPSRCRGFVAASGFGGPAVGAVGWVGPRRVMGLWYGNPRFAPIVKRGAQPPPPAVSRGASIAGNNQRRKLIGNQGRTHP